MIPGPGEESPLAGLRRRLEAKRPAFSGDSDAPPLGGGGPPGSDDPDRRGWGPELLASRDHASTEEEHAGANGDADVHGGDGAPAAHELLLVDLVSYDGCQHAAPEDPETASLLFLRFARGALGRPAPSDARRAADAVRRVPAEELGLYVAPRLRVNDGSLYKLEQRLARAVKLDGAALARRARGGAPPADALPVAAAAAAARWWFGADGLMVQEPSPLKDHKERPHRRWDQDEASTAAAFLPAAVHAGGAADQGRSYRLDIEVGRLEFFVHPLMAWEHQLAAKLLSMYREYKRRQAVRLVPFYARRLAALEDALLRVREELFTVSEAAAAAAATGSPAAEAAAAIAAGDEPPGGRGSPSRQQRQRRRGPNGGGPVGSLQDQSTRSSGEGMTLSSRLEGLVTRCAALEEEVAEARQLRDEERALLAATVEAMRRVWDRLRAVRAQQGRAVMDLQMALVPQAGVGAEDEAGVEDEEAVPVQQDGLTRKDLDFALALAEVETIAGLPDWPASFAADPQSQQAVSEEGKAAAAAAQTVAGFKPRRVECMCTAHAAARAALVSRLAVLKGRVSCDPQDPELRALEDKLTALGPAPRRVARPTPEQAAAARAKLQAAAAKRQTAVEPVLTTLDGEARACSGSGGTVSGPKFSGRCRYYARLLINGRVVGASRVVAMREDFTVDFRDVFSVRVLKWPESLELQLWEQGTLADRQLATLYLPIPGSGGTPHIDPQPRPLSWAGPEPVPRQELEKAAALLHGGAAPMPTAAAHVVRRAQALRDAGSRSECSATAAATAGAGSHRPHRQRVGEPDPAGPEGPSHLQALEEEEAQEEEPASAEGGAEGEAVSAAAGAMGPSADDAGEGSAPIFPSGVLFVRSGWVPDAGLSAIGVGAFGGALGDDAATAAAEAAGGGGFDAADATATLTLVRPFAGSSPPPPPVAGAQWRLYDNPLSSDSGGGGVDRTEWGSGKLSTGNLPQKGPSAEFGGSRLSTLKRGGGLGWDAETAPELMPPRPAVTRDQALRRAVVGSGKGSRAAAAEWLARHPADPNDPRNADLLELMRAREAAAAGTGAPSDRFRLGVPPDLAMPPGDRASDRRAAFLRRRWEAGVLRRGDRGAQRIVAPLAAGDGVDQQHDRMRALAALEAAALGLPAADLLPADAGSDTAAAGAAFEGEDAAVGGLLVAPPGERRQRAATRWAGGALARALEARQQRIRDFALRLRGAGHSGPAGAFGGGGGGRRLRTDDVVKDAALPEFRLDLSSLAALLQPARPLRPRRLMVRKITAAVPRETALVVTLQRAANLPARLPLGPGGAGRRQTASPVRGAANRIQGSSWGSPSARGRPGVTASPGGPPLAARATADWESGGPGGWEDVEGDPLGGDGGVSVFVEVAFGGVARRTVAVDSAAPIWNEQVAFPVFGLNEDASPVALRESEGIVTISLFDEVLTPAAAQRLERARALRGTASTAGAAAAAAAAGSGTGPGANVAAWEALTEGGGALPERERRFLGCLRVPLAAVYQAESIEGTFNLEVPPVILGYHQPTPQPPTLSAFITLRPRLAAPAPPDEERAPGEREDVARHAARWVAALRALPQCRGRVVRAAAVDLDGLGTLLPRFVAPMRVPPAFEAEAAALDPANAESAARLMLGLSRWVAAVPFLEDAAFRRAARVDVWCGNAEALALGGGDHEEHAHLLAGLFLAVGQEALVVLGTSLQGAAAAFVLTTGRLAGAAGPADAPAAVPQAPAPLASAAVARTSGQRASTSAEGRNDGQQQQQRREDEQQQQQLSAEQTDPAAAQQADQAGAAAAAAAAVPPPPPAEVAAAPDDPGVWDVTRLRLWNPLTGGCVPVRDPACELREVGTVYDAVNVWANVQPSGHPWDMSWNLSNGAAWRPFFGAALPPRELASMQVDPSYDDLDPRVYEELEARVEEAVRGALYDARSVVVTQPNSKLSRVLKALLRELPAQLSAIDTAGLEASIAMAEGAGAAQGVGQEALDYARGKLEERARLLKGLQVAHNDRVAREMRGCAVNGHVLALPFSDAWAAAASEAVLSTGVHRTVDPRVKFALAAHVERLGAPWVCRIWIYVAAIRDAA